MGRQSADRQLRSGKFLPPPSELIPTNNRRVYGKG